jgi:hypothetical protein
MINKRSVEMNDKENDFDISEFTQEELRLLFGNGEQPSFPTANNEGEKADENDTDSDKESDPYKEEAKNLNLSRNVFNHHNEKRDEYYQKLYAIVVSSNASSDFSNFMELFKKYISLYQPSTISFFERHYLNDYELNENYSDYDEYLWFNDFYLLFYYATLHGKQDILDVLLQYTYKGHLLKICMHQISAVYNGDTEDKKYSQVNSHQHVLDMLFKHQRIDNYVFYCYKLMQISSQPKQEHIDLFNFGFKKIFELYQYSESQKILYNFSFENIQAIISHISELTIHNENARDPQWMQALKDLLVFTQMVDVTCDLDPEDQAAAKKSINEMREIFNQEIDGGLPTILYGLSTSIAPSIILNSANQLISAQTTTASTTSATTQRTSPTKKPIKKSNRNFLEQVDYLGVQIDREKGVAKIFYQSPHDKYLNTHQMGEATRTKIIRSNERMNDFFSPLYYPDKTTNLIDSDSKQQYFELPLFGYWHQDLSGQEILEVFFALIQIKNINYSTLSEKLKKIIDSTSTRDSILLPNEKPDELMEVDLDETEVDMDETDDDSNTNSKPKPKQSNRNYFNKINFIKAKITKKQTKKRTKVEKKTETIKKPDDITICKIFFTSPSKDVTSTKVLNAIRSKAMHSLSKINVFFSPSHEQERNLVDQKGRQYFNLSVKGIWYVGLSNEEILSVYLSVCYGQNVQRQSTNAYKGVDYSKLSEKLQAIVYSEIYGKLDDNFTKIQAKNISTTTTSTTTQPTINPPQPTSNHQPNSQGYNPTMFGLGQLQPSSYQNFSPALTPIPVLNANTLSQPSSSSSATIAPVINSSNQDIAMSNPNALNVAIQRGDGESVRMLLENGASVDLPDEKGFCSFHYAILKNDLEIFKQLVGRVQSANIFKWVYTTRPALVSFVESYKESANKIYAYLNSGSTLIDAHGIRQENNQPPQPQNTHHRHSTGYRQQ